MSTDEAPDGTAPPDTNRRAALNAVKLAALVRDRWALDGHPGPFGPGAAMVVGDTAFVLLDDEPAVRPAHPGEGVEPASPGSRFGLGAALAWSRRHDAHTVHVIAGEAQVGEIARVAPEFSAPISVWFAEGRRLVEAAAVDPDHGAGPPDAPDLVAALEAHGLNVVVEGDRLSGEYRGLEVVRIVRALDDGEPILEVGVGRFDRELTAMMHGDLPDASAVGRVVEQLETIRRPDGPNHPLARLVPERWLRATLVADPGRVGCDDLVAAPSPTPRDRLRTRGSAAAVGTRAGDAVVVVTTVGVDLEAVVQAADARRWIDPDATLLLAMPERDVLATTTALVADLARPAEVVPVHGDWRS